MAWTTPITWASTILQSSVLNPQIRDNLNFLYGDTAWTAVGAFTGTWANFGGSFNAAGYRKIGTVVHLRGIIKSGTIGTAAFTLPVGYRPLATWQYATPSNNAHGQCTVTAAGVVTPTVGSNLDFSLDGLTFDTI